MEKHGLKFICLLCALIVGIPLLIEGRTALRVSTGPTTAERARMARQADSDAWVAKTYQTMLEQNPSLSR